MDAQVVQFGTRRVSEPLAVSASCRNYCRELSAKGCRRSGPGPSRESRDLGGLPEGSAGGVGALIGAPRFRQYLGSGGRWRRENTDAEKFDCTVGKFLNFHACMHDLMHVLDGKPKNHCFFNPQVVELWCANCAVTIAPKR